MARSLGGLYIAGASIGLISIFLPRAPHTNVGALAVNIALAYLGGAIVLLLLRRLPAWTFHLALLAGTALITRAVYYSGDGVSYYGIWYLWAALFGFSFFRRREAIVHVAVVAAAYGFVLATRHEPTAEGRWVTTIASLVIAGIFIDALVRRVRRQREQASQDAANLAAVVEAMHRIYQRPTAKATRHDLCRTALRVASADGAVLWEPTAAGDQLIATASAGAELEPRDCVLTGALSGAARAFLDSQPLLWHPGAEGAAELGAELDGSLDCTLWQPVVRDQRAVAVIALYWLREVGTPPPSVRTTVALLATQAAVAIERVELLGRLQQIALTDELTGLLNRRGWSEALTREMARARREHAPLCVAMLDIDGLKKVNDSFGHPAGDELLRKHAAAWRAALRPSDLLARHGGDEFAIAFLGCSLEEAERLAERLELGPRHERSFSVGIVEWDGLQKAHELIAAADARLYEAKAARFTDALAVRSSLT
jgi:diguanylate cyclase (GGDEF)-like protein